MNKKIIPIYGKDTIKKIDKNFRNVKWLRATYVDKSLNVIFVRDYAVVNTNLIEPDGLLLQKMTDLSEKYDISYIDRSELMK